MAGNKEDNGVSPKVSTGSIPDKYLEDAAEFMEAVGLEYDLNYPETALIADLLRARDERVRAEERERCAKIVESWHIKKGGYCEMAWTLRAGLGEE